jgi:molybdopterin synthase sulfur carrier subunit
VKIASTFVTNGIKLAEYEVQHRLGCSWPAGVSSGLAFIQPDLMRITVRIPTPLRKLTNNEELVEVSASNVSGAITQLQSRYPGIKERLLDENGSVRRFVNVYVNEEDIRFLQNQQTALKDGDEISIIPAIAGG